mgnify:CR=1 FL=1
MSRRAYPDEVAAGTGWSRWVQPSRHKVYRFACCDCYFVHGIEFRVSMGRAQFRARQLKRNTAALRREAVKRGDRIWYVSTKGSRTTVHVLQRAARKVGHND